MSKKLVRLSIDELSLVNNYRAELSKSKKHSEYFEELINDNGNEDYQTYILKRSSIYIFFTKIFSTYLKWCNQNNVCFFCSLHMIMETTYNSKNQCSTDSKNNKLKKHLH